MSSPIAGANVARVTIAFTTGDLSDALTRGRRTGRLTGHGRDPGHVRTWAEHDAVVDAAWMASGVNDVRDVLTVTG